MTLQEIYEAAPGFEDYLRIRERRIRSDLERDPDAEHMTKAELEAFVASLMRPELVQIETAKQQAEAVYRLRAAAVTV